MCTFVQWHCVHQLQNTMQIIRSPRDFFRHSVNIVAKTAQRVTYVLHIAISPVLDIL